MNVNINGMNEIYLLDHCIHNMYPCLYALHTCTGIIYLNKRSLSNLFAFCLCIVVVVM